MALFPGDISVFEGFLRFALKQILTLDQPSHFHKDSLQFGDFSHKVSKESLKTMLFKAFKLQLP